MSTGLSATRASVLTTSATIYYDTDVQSSGEPQWSYGQTQYGYPGTVSTEFMPVSLSNNSSAAYYILRSISVARTATRSSILWSLPNNTISTSSNGYVIITGLTPGTSSSFSATLSTYTVCDQYGTYYYAELYDEDRNSLNTYSSIYGDFYVAELYTWASTLNQIGWTLWDDPIPQNPQPEGASSSYDITIYTRPGNFTEFDSFDEDETVIESAAGLTVGKVNRWMAHCNKFAHWWNQNGNDVTGNIPQVNAGDLIKASWYNACVAACANSATRPQNVTADVTYITPKVFSDLGAAISADDNTSVS